MDYFSHIGDGLGPEMKSGDSSAWRTDGSRLAEDVREADSLIVAKQVFQDFGLSDPELARVANSLWMMSGGPELRRIMDRARKKSTASWDSVDDYHRAEILRSVMAFHCSSADMERMALRTGAGLMLLGEPELGRKIVENATVSQFGVHPAGAGVWLRMGQICVYVFMIVILGIQSAVTGLYLFLIPGIAVFVSALLIVWLLERNKWKHDHEQREAKSYVLALSKLSQGVPLDQLFAPDGSLRTSVA